MNHNQTELFEETGTDCPSLIGYSEETIRRWVRSTRAQFLVELSDTNQELEQKIPLLRKQNESQPDGAIRRDRNGLPVFDWLLQRVALEESFREEGAPPHATPADDPKLSIEGTNDDTQPSGEDTDDSPQTEYIRVHREVYRDLIGQLGTKDKQIARKDTQLDNTIQRNGRRTHHQRPVTTLATTGSSVLA